jgi:hypothetical protein
MKDYMKKSNNIYLLPTDQPTGIFETNSGLQFSIMNKVRHGEFKGFHIYITSSEEIKDVRPHKGKWQLEQGQILNKFPDYLTDLSDCKLVVMTTDPTLIADGVQSIDDEFLEWFVKNSSCEFVEVNKKLVEFPLTFKMMYKIIIPQDEPNEIRYSEDEVRELLIKGLTHNDDKLCGSLVTVQKEIRTANFNVWFEENKKK